MLDVMIHIAGNTLLKFVGILQTMMGWLVFAAMLVMDYFGGHGFVVFLVTAVTLMDAGWGIAVSVRQGKFTLSELARLTITKLAVYGCALFVFVGLDKMTDTVITGSVVGAAIVLVEFWSSCASMLILFPHMPFLRLMKRALTGEIASKLHISDGEVEDALEKGLTRRYTEYHDGEASGTTAAMVLLMGVLLLAGCKTRTVVMSVTEVRTDTTYITREQRDSIWLHDSIHVAEKQKGDTVFVEVERWHKKYIERNTHDTIFVSTHDSIPVPYPVPEYVEKELSWWQRMRLALGNGALALLALLVAYGGWRLWRKFK